MVVEYKKYHLTTDEGFRLFWHSFALQLPPEGVLYIAARKNFINELTKSIWQRLQASGEQITAYATGLGEITLQNPPVKGHSPVNHRIIAFAQPMDPLTGPIDLSPSVDLDAIRIQPKIPILSLSNATILMGLSDLKGSNYKYFSSRILPDSPGPEAEMVCLPAYSGKDYEYDNSLGKERPLYQ